MESDHEFKPDTHAQLSTLYADEIGNAKMAGKEESKSEEMGKTGGLDKTGEQNRFMFT